MSSQVEPSHYFKFSYYTKERFCSYWHQISKIILLNPQKVLEIGIGSGFVSRYLKNENVNITTIDIDQKLKPDVSGSVLAMPFANNFFDVVACYEVLEHLPYDNFSNALKEIFRVSQKHTVLSLPDSIIAYRVFFDLPKVNPIKKLFRRPFQRTTYHKFDGQHYWEIGKKYYPLKKIETDIEQSGFRIMKTYRLFEDPYHRFFLLKKQ